MPKLSERDGEQAHDIRAMLARGEAIQCPRCQAISLNLNDVEYGYCGRCHDWTTPRPVPSEKAFDNGRNR